jgi:hypothetical protein
MLLRETSALYGQNNTKQSNTLRGQNATFNYDKAGGTYKTH